MIDDFAIADGLGGGTTKLPMLSEQAADFIDQPASQHGFDALIDALMQPSSIKTQHGNGEIDGVGRSFKLFLPVA